MRLLFLTDRIWGHSAYAKVLKSWCTRLKDEHEIATIPMARALLGGDLTLDNITIYGARNDPMGEDVAYEKYDEFNADMLITLKEPWNFKHIHNTAMNFVPMAIIDHEPVSPHITKRLHTTFKTIAISRFGQRELRNNDLDSHYIPHGVEPHYKPLDKKKCRTVFHLDPDKLTIGIVAMNRYRKMVPRQLRGVRAFMDANPDMEIQLLLWSPLQGLDTSQQVSEVGDYGINLLQEVTNLDLYDALIVPDERIFMQGIPEYREGYDKGMDMVKLYNCFDVLLHCTGGEGAGLPLLEAQACGVPVVTTDYSGGPEHVGAGLTVPYHDYVILATPGIRYALADIDGMADALGKILNSDLGKLEKRALRFIERFRWDNIKERYIDPFLDECEKDLRPRITKEGVKKW
jgi:glycosyltransferase involved in cell wall biosynthesis